MPIGREVVFIIENAGRNVDGNREKLHLSGFLPEDNAVATPIF
jgi:hypothetical protein